MPKYQITSPDGRKFEITAPDGATQEEVLSYAQSQYKTPEPKEESSSLKNLGLGAARGIAGIGATIAQPFQYAAEKLFDTPPTMSEMIVGNHKSRSPLGNNAEMRQNLEDNLSRFGADKDSLSYQGGKLASEIAGTWGVGGLAGRGLQAVSQSPKAMALAEALRTGGMAKGVAPATNIAGGAGSAALGTLLVDQDNTGTGAVVGGAIPLAGKAATAGGGLVADLVGGFGTHTGGESIKTAARSGMEGGQTGKAFIDNLRGNVPMTDVLDSAKANLANIRQDRLAAYKQGMQGVSNDKTVLDFNPIAQELRNQASVGNYKGKVINKSTADTQAELKSLVDDWGSSNPAEFHTPEGLDALKKAIGDVRESTPYGTPSRKVADSLYNSVKAQINKQAPEYANTMKGYSEASDQISEIEKALSLGNKASVDTAMRKLQSLTRNNVNTNYGNRLELARQLEEQGGNEILPALSGQALSSWTPRGLGGVTAGLTAGAGYINPSLIPLLATQSPRIVGETAYKTGQLARGLRGSGKAAPSTAAILNALNGD